MSDDLIPDNIEDIEPRDDCPVCGSSVEQVSVTPLEEHCMEFTCDYYRAEAGDDVILET